MDEQAFHMSASHLESRHARPLLKLKRYVSFAFLSLSLFLTGCNKDEIEGSEVLSKVSPYFPDSVIYKFDRRVLWIQTKVDGVGAKTAAAIFEQACQQANNTEIVGNLVKFNLSQLMQLDHRTILIIGFRRWLVAWDVRNGESSNHIPRYELMNWQQAPSWFVEHVGSNPTPDAIHVLTLQDIQNTPKGQPLQLQTLAQIQAANKAKEQAAINDFVLKEKLEQNP
jgi:hypothetical protein